MAINRMFGDPSKNPDKFRKCLVRDKRLRLLLAEAVNGTRTEILANIKKNQLRLSQLAGRYVSNRAVDADDQFSYYSWGTQNPQKKRADPPLHLQLKEQELAEMESERLMELVVNHVIRTIQQYVDDCRTNFYVGIADDMWDSDHDTVVPAGNLEEHAFEEVADEARDHSIQ